MAKHSDPKDAELVRMANTLRAVYREIAPGRQGRIISDIKLAEMTRRQVMANWDYPLLQLAHRVARTINGR